MPTATATVATDRPAPYMKQLCRHFGHKTEVSFDDERGRIAIGEATCELDATRPGALVLTAVAGDPPGLERVTSVVGSHLERFGSRDGLQVAWTET